MYKNVQTPVLTVQVVHRCVFMVRMVYAKSSQGRDLLTLMERVQKFDCATPDPSETAVHFHETEASVEKNRPRGSRERAPVYVQCKLKENDEVAHQQLPSTINFDSVAAQQVIR